MTPIEVLVEEHEKIVRVLDALDGWAEGLDGADDGERPVLRRFMTCIREFVDPIHHGKEEDILFALMVESGFPKQAGPIAVMLHEHDIARRLIATMHGLAEQATPWTAEQRDEAKRAAGSYTELMRQHIDKENGILYPMADARLPPAAQAEMAARFARFAETTGARDAELRALAEELVAEHA
jgi:hemerythrin-like domain-containing protein